MVRVELWVSRMNPPGPAEPLTHDYAPIWMRLTWLVPIARWAPEAIRGQEAHTKWSWR